jgi:hypothetical protein
VIDKGYLLYKCKRCGELIYSLGVTTKKEFLHKLLSDNKYYGTHNCLGEHIGILDLIGLEKENAFDKYKTTNNT